MSEPSPVDFWRMTLADSYASWVLFRHGACVILDETSDETSDDPAGRAVALLRRHGPVVAGTDAADFNVVAAPGGRLVTCYRPEILVYVSHRDCPAGQPDIVAGLMGRMRRHLDAEAPALRHVASVRHPQPACACQTAPGGQLAVVRELGMDGQYGEGAALACRVCGRRWLRYFYENEAFSRSGRWYLGQVPVAVALGVVAAEVRDTLARLPGYFTGGSYFDGRIGRGSGAIVL